MNGRGAIAMDEKNPSQARVLGITLEQYAGIQTALAQGFSLDDVLRNERLSRTRWTRARVAWGDKIARDGHGGPLSAAFSHTSARAAEWLGRRIEPLDDDLRAWCAFLGAYAAEAAPTVMLQRVGLRGDDVQRLVLAWKLKTDADPALEKKAAEIAATRPRAVPSVRVTEGRLRPFPWSPGPEAPAPAAAPKPRAAAQSAGATPSPGVPVLEKPSFLLAAEVAVATASPPSAPAVPVAPVAPLAPAPAPSPAIMAGIGATVATFTLPLSVAAALPFNPGAPASSAAPPKGTDAAPAKATDAPAPVGSLTGTVMALELPRGPTVPFRADAPPANATDSAPARAADVASPSGAAAAPAKATDSAPAPSAAPAESWKGTAIVFELPKNLRPLPFRSTPVPKDGSEAAENRAAPESVAAAALPPSPPPSPPALTLEQHASLCAELAFRPDEQPRILSRYRVTDEAKQALDRLYRDRSDRSAAWDAAYRTYFEWLSSQDKGRV